VHPGNQFGNGLALVGNADGFFESFLIAGNDPDLFAAAGGSDLEKFLMDGVSRDDQGVHGFALRPVGSHAITVSELPEIAGQGTSILQLDPALAIARRTVRPTVRKDEIGIHKVSRQKPRPGQNVFKGILRKITECLYIESLISDSNLVFSWSKSLPGQLKDLR
jgi:hypothetical protein